MSMLQHSSADVMTLKLMSLLLKPHFDVATLEFDVVTLL